MGKGGGIHVTGTPEDLAQNVGGRLTVGKSSAYREAVTKVEARANAHLWKWMLASDLAYVLSAADLKLLPREAAAELLPALVDLLDSGPPEQSPTPGDIVVTREVCVTERVGPVTGGWLHLGRNRGESLRSYLPRLFFRDALHRERVALLDMLDVLATKAETHLEALAPNFHHLQHAGYTTLGEYLLSWATTLRPHLDRLAEADRRLDLAPSVLGGRERLKALGDRVRERLGFTRQARLRREAMWTEDQFWEPFALLSFIAVDLGRLAEDLRIWMTPEFGFFEPSDAHASSSSALPQKKNPFGLEAVIGGAAMGLGRLAGQLAANLSPSDQSDALFHAGSLYQQALDVIAQTAFMAELVDQGTFDLAALRDKATWGFAGTSEAADMLVFEHGVPFRAAHHALGGVVRALAKGQTPPAIADLLEAATGRRYDLDEQGLLKVVRGEVIPATALDLPRVREARDDLAREIAEFRAEMPEHSPSEQAVARLKAEATARF